MIEAPSADEVENKISSLLTGKISRDEADRWAAQWVAATSCPDMHPAIWKALGRVHGCDLTHGPGLDYLHSNDQIAEWLQDFRENISG